MPPGSVLNAVSSHCSAQYWCTGGNFLSKLTKKILYSQMMFAESTILLCLTALKLFAVKAKFCSNFVKAVLCDAFIWVQLTSVKQTSNL